MKNYGDDKVPNAIAEASEFVISIFLGSGAFEKRYAKTLPEAATEARSLNKTHGTYGRRAMVYALNARGQTFIPNSFWDIQTEGDDTQ